MPVIALSCDGCGVGLAPELAARSAADVCVKSIRVAQSVVGQVISCCADLLREMESPTLGSGCRRNSINGLRLGGGTPQSAGTDVFGAANLLSE